MGGERQKQWLVYADGPSGDTVTHIPEVNVYLVHLGAGSPPAAPRAEVSVNVPGELLERMCWALAVALCHHDGEGR